MNFQEEAASSKSDIIKQLRAADANKTKSKIHQPDKNIPNAASYQVNILFIRTIFYQSIVKVLNDYDAMLNQTNIGANNNKFYVIQVLKQGSSFYTYTRWGRVVSD